jgi:hypothetical protein
MLRKSRREEERVGEKRRGGKRGEIVGEQI